MKTPKTIMVISCRSCGGEYYGNDERITLHPGDESALPDELTIIVKKIARCTGCKLIEERTKGGKRKRIQR